MGKTKEQSATYILDARLAVIRQWDKAEAIEYLIPRYIKDGLMYNFKDGVVMSYAGEDCVFHEDKDLVKNVSRITDKFLNDLYLPINKYLGSASEQEAGPEVEEATDEPTEELTETEDESVEAEDKFFNLIGAVEKLIGKDKLKKAKKLIAEYEGHDDYKKAKKLIKKAS